MASEKFESLEALRGLAAVLVVLFHSSFYSFHAYNQFIRHSYLFVDFFFVLSGFVITHAYGNAINTRRDLARFAMLRFGRVYPLHLFMLLAYIPWVLFKNFLYSRFPYGIDPAEVDNMYSFVSNIFLVQSLGIYEALSWNIPSWSIGTEFYTYLVFAAVILLAPRQYKTLAALVLSVAAYIFLLSKADTIAKTHDLGFVRTIGGFFLGSVTYSIYRKINFKFNRITASILEIGFLAAAVIFVSRPEDDVSMQMASVGSFAIIVLLFAAQKKGVISGLLGLGFPQFVGRLSYSIYMTHYLIISLVMHAMQHIFKMPVILLSGHEFAAFGLWTGLVFNVAVVAGIMLVSSFTYYFIENPFRAKVRGLADRWFQGSPSAVKAVTDLNVNG